jgi:hypothetical protein
MEDFLPAKDGRASKLRQMKAVNGACARLAYAPMENLPLPGLQCLFETAKGQQAAAKHRELLEQQSIDPAQPL